LILPIVPFFAANEKSATTILPMNTMQTPEFDEAVFYNDLPKSLENAWLLLEDAAHNRHSPGVTARRSSTRLPTGLLPAAGWCLNPSTTAPMRSNN